MPNRNERIKPGWRTFSRKIGANPSRLPLGRLHRWNPTNDRSKFRQPCQRRRYQVRVRSDSRKTRHRAHLIRNCPIGSGNSNGQSVCPDFESCSQNQLFVLGKLCASCIGLASNCRLTDRPSWCCWLIATLSLVVKTSGTGCWIQG